MPMILENDDEKENRE